MLGIAVRLVVIDPLTGSIELHFFYLALPV